MKREEALNLLKENIKNQNLIKHSLAVEAGMRNLAEYFQEDKEKWGICGLLHDIDYEKTKGRANLHSRIGAEMLKNLGFDKEIWEAVLTHNEAHKIFPKTKMAKALYCLDPLTGLIVAATLVLPSKKISDLKVKNILNRFKEKAFAKGANREIIKKCQDYLGLSLEKFVEITLSAMQKISDELGL
jgi:putative nucleotidyltransferase with HDIG domain